MSQKIKSLVFVFILSLTLVSAATIYSGESYELELEKPFDYYSIVGNSTEVILDVVQNGNNVTITPDIYSEEDSYEIIFFDKNTETITVYVPGGGGGGGGLRTVYKDRNISVDRNVTEYIDREVEVLGEDTVVEKAVRKTSLIGFIFIGFLIVIVIGLVIRLRNVGKLPGINSDTIEREDE